MSPCQGEGRGFESRLSLTRMKINPPTQFHTLTGQKLPLPLFFPDATRAIVKSLDSLDIKNTKTPGILVNTYHLVDQPGKSTIKSFSGIRNYMNWDGACISDSGGFQIMSIAKSSNIKNPVSDRGVVIKNTKKGKQIFTPSDSIDLQISLRTDLIVVLDDFTPANASLAEARETVERTIKWAKICKEQYTKRFKNLPLGQRPYLIGVVQGGFYQKLRVECTKRLVDIGFDGLGFGGWPVKDDHSFDYESAQSIKKYTPKDYLLYGLGIGKPHEIKNLVKMGWHIFDCVLPSRDARHKRLYTFNADSIKNIDLSTDKFYSYYTPDKDIYYKDKRPVSLACDCPLCKNYSRAYLCHLFKIGDFTAGRLATIHNLRFYSLLMEKLQCLIN